MVSYVDECSADDPKNEEWHTASCLIYCCERITVSLLNIKKFIKLILIKTIRIQVKAYIATQLLKTLIVEVCSGTCGSGTHVTLNDFPSKRLPPANAHLP